MLGCGGLVVLLVLIVGMGGCKSYNGLVGSAQTVDASWAQVQNQYQRRYELVPNLVKTVEGAANFEKSTLTEITEARASVGKLQINATQAPATAEELEKADKTQRQLSSALSRLLVVAERYPELKATANFRDLQAQLEGTENRIAVERMRFNEAVQGYNTSIRRFPTLLVARLGGFQSKPYFQATAGAETAPKVDFNFGAPKTAPGK
jgi:LemA protein